MAQTFPVLAPIVTGFTEVNHPGLWGRAGLGSAEIGESTQMRKRLFRLF
jgi:hypothetical protein